MREAGLPNVCSHTHNTQRLRAHTLTQHRRTANEAHTERDTTAQTERSTDTHNKHKQQRTHTTQQRTHNEQLTHTTSTHYTVHHAEVLGLSAVDHHSTQQEPPATRARRGTHAQETHREKHSTHTTKADRLLKK